MLVGKGQKWPEGQARRQVGQQPQLFLIALVHHEANQQDFSGKIQATHSYQKSHLLCLC